MPNNRVSAPYGDIAFFNTPNADRVAYSLYNEEKKRGIRLQNENAQLDNLLNKEFSKVRSADTEEIINKYNDYKNTKKQVLFDKKIQNDPRLYNAYNQAAGEKLADLYASINKSAETKNAFEMTHQERKANHQRFSNDFYTKMNAYSALPTSKLPQDWQDQLKYQGSITNFEPLLSKSAGSKRLIGQAETTKEGLQNKITAHEGYNSPFEFYNTLTSQLAGSDVNEDFVKHFGNITPEQEQDIDSQYQQLISDPNYRKVYGIPEGYDFPNEAYTTETGRAARLLAEQHAINRQPSSRVTYNTDQKASGDAQLERQMAMEGARQKNRERNLQLANKYRESYYDYKSAQTKEQEKSVLDNMLNEQYNDGVETLKSLNRENLPFTLYGKSYNGVPIKVPRGLQKKYAHTEYDEDKKKDITEYPDDYFMTDDKKYIVPIFYQKTSGQPDLTPSGNNRIIAKKGTPILASQYKIDMGAQFLTRKKLADEVEDEFSPPSQDEPPIITSQKEIRKSTKQSTSDSYTRSELKGSGWTDEQIDQAVKLGKIKLR